MKLGIHRCSHFPALIKCVNITSGPVLELGSGIFSTSVLHWMCQPKQRRLVTYENNPKYYEWAKQCATEWHEIHLISDWDALDLSGEWSVALVDHAPDEHRVNEVKRLAHVDYVVIHDTDNKWRRKYRFSEAEHLFKWRYKYRDAVPHTSVWSNKHDLSSFIIGRAQ